MHKTMAKEKEVFEKVAEEVGGQFRLDIASMHGLSHWKRVKRIGLYLASGTDADIRVVTLFSCLHDSQRENEYDDPEHGSRAAEYALTLHRRGLLEANDKQLNQLLFACKHHSDKRAVSNDITIQTCWDADRLDLYRVEEIPDNVFLYTEAAKKKESRDFVLKLLGK